VALHSLSRRGTVSAETWKQVRPEEGEEDTLLSSTYKRPVATKEPWLNGLSIFCSNNSKQYFYTSPNGKSRPHCWHSCSWGPGSEYRPGEQLFWPRFLCFSQPLIWWQTSDQLPKRRHLRQRTMSNTNPELWINNCQKPSENFMAALLPTKLSNFCFKYSVSQQK
jgi:hypothetical protein